MTNYEIVGSLMFVLVVSLVSYYFGKYDGYRMGDRGCSQLDGGINRKNHVRY
jgi:hypothetical protein